MEFSSKYGRLLTLIQQLHSEMRKTVRESIRNDERGLNEIVAEGNGDL